jgi:hypothetical protein
LVRAIGVKNKRSIFGVARSILDTLLRNFSPEGSFPTGRAWRDDWQWVKRRRAINQRDFNAAGVAAL